MDAFCEGVGVDRLEEMGVARDVTAGVSLLHAAKSNSMITISNCLE
jgi:hypothetical protein